jgi:hypothetical protein
VATIPLLNQKARKPSLNSVTVIEEAIGKTLVWEPGMKSLKEEK